MNQEQERGFKVTDKRAAFQEESFSSPTEDATSSQPADSPPVEEAQQHQTEDATSQPAASPSVEEAQHTHHEDPIGQDSYPPLPEANLLTLVFSLYTQAQIYLGTVPDPMTQQVTKDLKQAKYNIDLLGVLKEKTQGNLTQEEAQALEQLLYEVRMAYVGGSQ